MAQDQAIVSCAADAWTQLTNADATAITFQALDGPIYIRFTTDTTTPTEAAGILYEEGQGELNTNLSQLTKLASADRVWAKPADNSGKPSSVYVDHA